MNELDEMTQSAHAESPREEQPRPEAVSVEIYDQVYTLRGTDPAYIQHLATVVDAKMRAVAALGSTVDSLRVAVLASLNVADELVMLRERYNHLASSVVETQATQTSSQRTIKTLSGMLDELLDAELDGQSVRRAG